MYNDQCTSYTVHCTVCSECKMYIVHNHEPFHVGSGGEPVTILSVGGSFEYVLLVGATSVVVGCSEV